MIPPSARLDPTRKLPLLAALLGAAGALPFVGLALAPHWGIEPFARAPIKVLGDYAAVILSFTGAVHWGLAMAETGGRRDSPWQFLVSVMPALIGWFSITLLPLAVALRLMALAFVLLLLYDLRAVRIGLAPVWYRQLRWPLTLIVVPCLLWGSIIA